MDSTHIGGDAQAAVNVLTDNSYLEKRPGNTLLTTILSGSPVKYTTSWTSAGGSLYLIGQASTTIYQTNFSGSPVALSTISSGANLTTISAFSRLEFADSIRPLFYWDGNSTGTVTDGASGAIAPVCTYVDFKDTRLWCANLPNGFSTTGNTTNGGGASTVIVSSAGGDGYWAVPANFNVIDTAPNRFDFNPNDGDSVTCLARTPWGEFVGKRYSSYIVKGNGNLSYDPRVLDPKIGCVDNRSVQMVNGVLQWLAVDGVYAYDGGGSPQLITRELDPLMQTVREATFSQGQWATQLQSDWQTGTESTTTFSLPALPWDYTTTPGAIFPSSYSLLDNNSSFAVQGSSGFAAGSLVNIDTQTYPLSVGAAQVVPSSSGVNIWISSYPYDANVNTHFPYWSIESHSNQFYSGSGVTGFMASNAPNAGPDTARVFQIYSTNASTSAQVSGGPMYGYWAIDWGIYSANIADRCRNALGGGIGSTSECFEYMFISTGTTVATSLYGYKLEIDQVSAGNYLLSLVKVKNGTKSSLGSYSFAKSSGSSGVVSTNKIAVTRTVGGNFAVYYDGVLVFTAYDSDSSISANNSQNLSIYTNTINGAPVAFTNSLVSTITFNGYGNGQLTSRIFDTGMGSPLAGLVSSSITLQGKTNETELDFYIRSSTSPNDDMWTSYAASTSGVLAVLPRRYWQYQAQFYTHIASATPQLTSFSIPAVSTGYYYSKVDFVGTLITAWRQFGVTENNPGRYGYAVRQATYNFSASNTSISWTAQTANQNVNLSVSTPTYAQFRLDSTSLVSNTQGATAAEPITGIFLNWDQGANLPAASATLERRYMLCVTISTSATAPDTCLLRQKNGKWVQWSNGGTIGAMGVYNNNIIAADGGTTSKIWEILQPNVYNDDGSAINAYWVSEDYTNGMIFNNKILHEMWVDATPIQGSSLTVSYQYDKRAGYVDYQFSVDNGQALDPTSPVLLDQYGAINQFIPLSAGYQVGRYFRVKFSDNQLNDYWRVNAYLLYLEDQTRTIPYP